MKKDIVWFKSKIVNRFINFEIKYFSFKNGDFGDLNRVEINGENKGATIDFWSKDWLGIHLVDYKNNIEIINLLFNSTQVEEKEKGLDLLLENLESERAKF